MAIRAAREDSFTQWLFGAQISDGNPTFLYRTSPLTQLELAGQKRRFSWPNRHKRGPSYHLPSTWRHYIYYLLKVIRNPTQPTGLYLCTGTAHAGTQNLVRRQGSGRELSGSTGRRRPLLRPRPRAQKQLPSLIWARTLLHMHRTRRGNIVGLLSACAVA